MKTVIAVLSLLLLSTKISELKANGITLHPSSLSLLVVSDDIQAQVRTKKKKNKTSSRTENVATYLLFFSINVNVLTFFRLLVQVADFSLISLNEDSNYTLTIPTY